ncbi:MAG: DNA mismatch repair endonuclease MutL, partial [Phycisphaerae bacterium]|nr:DNA mismatch repair endonuclease MutL [Phycisphaerae bacterium]
NKKGEPYIHGDSGMPRTSYLHPKYLEFVERYYRKLGEALAAIASIAHARIRTRLAKADSGWEIAADGEDIHEPMPAAAPPGTSVEIRDLFFNTPARRKFLRTTNTEFGHVTEQIARLALPHPDIAFTLRHNGRESLNLPATEATLDRIADLFTPDLAEALLKLSQRTDSIGIAGYIGKPSAARSTTRWQYVFLNGRYIRDRLLGHALREAYRGLLAPGKSAPVFIFIDIDPGDVDVNVHPTKIEVRFRDSNRVYGELMAALKETLNRGDLRPSADAGRPGDLPDARTDSRARTDSLKQAMADFFKKAPPPQPALSVPEGIRPQRDSRPPAQAPRPGPLAPPSRSAPSEPQRTWPPASAPAVGATPTDSAARDATDTSAPREAAPALSAAAPRPLLQIADTYIVTETNDGLVIVDQHALHERILYNQLKHRFAEGGLSTQRMLIPESFSVTAGEAALLESNAELLASLGIEVEPFGKSAFAVQQYPTILAERGVAMGPLLRELLDQLAEDDADGATEAAGERILETVLAMMACKAAIKAGDPLSDAEMAELLDQAAGSKKASACPHGRPTTLRMSLRELDKQFHRT